VIANEVLREGERILWCEKPTFLRYMRNQCLAIFCILVPIVIFGAVFTIGSKSPFAIIGALLVWALIVCMFILRWWCNVLETPRYTSKKSFFFFSIPKNSLFFALDKLKNQKYL
jgi:hypothetical protein